MKIKLNPDIIQKAYDLDSKKGCSWVGYMYDKGEGVPENKAKEIEFYKKGCNLGDSLECKLTVKSSLNNNKGNL